MVQIGGARHVVVGTRVQIPPLLLVDAHMLEVNLGAWFVEVDCLQGLDKYSAQNVTIRIVASSSSSACAR